MRKKWRRPRHPPVETLEAPQRRRAALQIEVRELLIQIIAPYRRERRPENLEIDEFL
jgi:hypothetical protein